MDVKKELLNFTQNVMNLKDKYNLTEKEMAKILGVSVANFKKIEKCEYSEEITVEALINLSNHFNIAPSRLIEINNEP